MTINYDKLWTMLEIQNIGKDQLRRAAGLTAYVFDKVEKNGTVQLDSLVKICSALNCELTDIVDIEYDSSANRAIPDIDFSDTDTFANGNQFIVLGYSSLYDLPIQLSAQSLQNYLANAFVSCKLSWEACQELIDALRESEISLYLPDGLEPSIDALPQQLPVVDADEEDACLEHQQIHNYLSWKLEKIANDDALTAEVFQKAETLSAKKSYVVETGILHAPRHAAHFDFEGHAIEKVDDCYPFTVLDSIGCTWISDLYVYTHRISDAVSYIDNFVDYYSSSPAATLLFTLQIKLGLDTMSILSCLGLPQSSIFEYGISNFSVYKRLLRRVRHPGFGLVRLLTRHLAINVEPFTENSYVEDLGCGLNPYFLTSKNAIYNDYVDCIKAKATEYSHTGMPISDVLEQFYPQHIIDSVLGNICKWYDNQSSVIDQIKLSWKTYHALKNAGLETVPQIITQHGETRGLSDVANSGLYQIPGMRSAQVEEVLKELSVFLDQPMEHALIERAVSYGELAFLANVQWPVCECIGLTHASLKILLEMKYRDTNEVIADYESGFLQEKCRQLLSTEHTAELLHSVHIIATGEYPVTHIVFSDFWKDHIANRGTSLQDLRKAYVHDLPMPYSVKEIESYIPTLFPGKSDAFKLLYYTRGCHMKWAVWPSEVLCSDILTPMDKVQQPVIIKAYYGLLNRQSYSRSHYIFVKFSAQNTLQYALYQLGSGNLKLLNSIPNAFLVNLFEAISFNAEVTATSQTFAEYFEEEYKKTLGYYCMKACFETGSDRNTSVYAPYIKEYQKMLETKVSHITCSETPFSSHTKRLLKEANIFDLKDFVYMSTTDIQSIPNISDWYVTDIVKNCLKLGVTVPEWEQWLANRYPSASKLMNMTVEELDLSIRSYNCLKLAGIDTVGDLTSFYDRADFMKVRNMGKRSLDEIEKKLLSLGVMAPWMGKETFQQKDPESIPSKTTQYETPHRLPVKSMDDLINKSEDELRQVRNLGSGNLDEVMQRLDAISSTLRQK